MIRFIKLVLGIYQLQIFIWMAVEVRILFCIQTSLGDTQLFVFNVFIPQ